MGIGILCMSRKYPIRKLAGRRSTETPDADSGQLEYGAGSFLEFKSEPPVILISLLPLPETKQK